MEFDLTVGPHVRYGSTYLEAGGVAGGEGKRRFALVSNKIRRHSIGHMDGDMRV